MAAQASVGANVAEGSVVQELLTNYKFIPTSEVPADANHRNGRSFTWQQKDPPFRQLTVECTGFAENGGTVYVCGELLSMLSEDLKEKIERNQRIKFDCSLETFDSVMSFVHSTNCVRPTSDVLLKWVPMFHDCQLPFLTDICVYCVPLSQDVLGDALTAAFRAENDLLLQYVLEVIQSRRQLQQLLDRYNAFRGMRNTRFAGEALGLIIELMAILPKAPPAFMSLVDPRRVAFNSAFSAIPRFVESYKQHQPMLRVPSPFRDFPLTVGHDNFYVSRPVLAQASRFFGQLFYGDFAEQGLAGFVVEGASSAELRSLLVLLLPTGVGLLWRLTPSAGGNDATKRRDALLRFIYEAVFCDDPLQFVNVFKLAEYYQITGLVDYLTDVAVRCLPWRQRLQLADLFKSREIMASLLTDDSWKELKREMAALATVLDEFSSPTKNLLVEFALRATNP